MIKPCTRLTADDRETISRGRAAGWRLKTIAAMLERHPSTITDEARQNGRYRRCYRALRAHAPATNLRRRPKQPPKLDRNERLRE